MLKCQNFEHTEHELQAGPPSFFPPSVILHTLQLLISEGCVSLESTVLTPDSCKPPDTDGDSGVWLLVTSCSMAELMIQQILSKAKIILSEHVKILYTWQSTYGEVNYQKL